MFLEYIVFIVLKIWDNKYLFCSSKREVLFYSFLRIVGLWFWILGYSLYRDLLY